MAKAANRSDHFPSRAFGGKTTKQIFKSFSDACLTHTIWMGRFRKRGEVSFNKDLETKIFALPIPFIPLLNLVFQLLSMQLLEIVTQVLTL